jgi:queuosine precursor transporter
METSISSMRYTYRYYNFLSMMFVTIMFGTYLLAYKMVAIGSFVVSGGIFLFPLNYAIADIITEVYGFDQTKRLIKYSFFCCLFFSLVVPLIAITPAPENWTHQDGYNYVLGNVCRFFLANTIGIVIGIAINGRFIAKWKIILNGKHFWLRSIGASLLGELITSIIAGTAAFLGTTDTLSVFKLMISIYLIKFIYAILLAWPNTLMVTHLKLKEKINLFDNKFVFNPFHNDKEKENAYQTQINRT